MVLRKLSQSFRIGTAFLLAVLSTGILQTMPVYATNNGTLKVHEVGTASGTESNDPKVCAFNFEGFGFDAGQEGYVVVEPQGGDSDTTDSAILSFGPASAAGGYYMTTDLNNGGDTLDQGHYKATLYGKDVHGVNLQDEKAKSKNFKVTCSAEAPTATATVKSCTPNSGTTDVVSVRVFNTDDGTNATVVYTVKLGNQTKTIELADGANGNVEFGGLAAGTYTATVTGSDGTVTLDSIVVAECPFVAAAPTATATVIPCTLNSGTTSKVSVRVFNTDDGTDAAVTYTIEMGGQTKTVTVPDGENRNVEFGGLDAGTYTATVTGSDGTVTLDSVVVAECEIQVADITAAIVCTPNGVSITLTNAGNALGTVTINGMSHTVAAGASKEVSLPFDIGTPFQTVVTIDTIGQVKTQTVNCAPGQVLGNNTQNNGGQGGGHVLATSTVLPAMLPATGAKDSPYMILVAALIAYGATYFLQGRRKLLRNQA